MLSKLIQTSLVVVAISSWSAVASAQEFGSDVGPVTGPSPMMGVPGYQPSPMVQSYPSPYFAGGMYGAPNYCPPGAEGNRFCPPGMLGRYFGGNGRRSQPIYDYQYRYKRPQNLLYPAPLQGAGAIVYPYYTVKGPDDFFLDK